MNQYAAMPSLHVGWDLLVGLALISAAGALWLRVLGRLMPVFMGLATVATANHYLLDVVAGVAFALAGHAIALQVERRRDARAVAVVPVVPVAAEAGVPAVPRPRGAEEQRLAPSDHCGSR